MKYLKSFESTEFNSYDFNPRTGEGISVDKIYEYDVVEIPYNKAATMGQQELKKLLVGKLVSFKEVVKINDRLSIRSIIWHYVYDVFIINELNRGSGKNEKIIYIWSHNVGNSPNYKNEQHHKVINAGTIDYLSFNKKKKDFKDWDPFGEEIDTVPKKGYVMPNRRLLEEWGDIDSIENFRKQKRLTISSQKMYSMPIEDVAEYLKKKLVGKVAQFYSISKTKEGGYNIGRTGNWWIDDVLIKMQSEFTWSKEKPTIYIKGHGYFQKPEQAITIPLYRLEPIEYIAGEDELNRDWDPFGEEF